MQCYNCKIVIPRSNVFDDVLEDCRKFVRVYDELNAVDLVFCSVKCLHEHEIVTKAKDG